MIKLYQYSHLDTENKEEIKFDITIFPDKTSQVWHLNPEPKDCHNSAKKFPDRFVIYWDFENESEIFHVLQLGRLLREYGGFNTYLKIPTMPFARQDKQVSNNTTFALKPFINLLENSEYFDLIETIDIHNSSSINMASSSIVNKIPHERIQEVLKDSDAHVICFPDKGASLRGYKYDREYYGEPIILDKKRNQETGYIEGLKFASKIPLNLTGFKVLLVDDIGDGMRTFIEACKLLKSCGAKEVYVYTTHGIYSKGLDIVFDAGIDRVFNYNEEVFDGRKK